MKKIIKKGNGSNGLNKLTLGPYPASKKIYLAQQMLLKSQKNIL